MCSARYIEKRLTLKEVVYKQMLVAERLQTEDRLIIFAVVKDLRVVSTVVCQERKRPTVASEQLPIKVFCNSRFAISTHFLN